VNGNKCFEECVAAYEGGEINRWGNPCTLESCGYQKKGGHYTTFKLNAAVFGAGIFTDNNTFEFSGTSAFTSNHATYTYGGMYAARSSLTFLATSSTMIIANVAGRSEMEEECTPGMTVQLIYLDLTAMRANQQKTLVEGSQHSEAALIFLDTTHLLLT